MNEKQLLISFWRKELYTTIRVLSAYPEEKLSLKPHEISKSAKELAWVFVVELDLIRGTIKGKFDLSQKREMPANYKDIIEIYNRECNELLDMLENMTEEELNEKIQFMTGPGKFEDIRKLQILWLLFCDMIHHRGQFSIYLRMSGGKVPSIYGPSYDEPWM